jgi:hypothetical protein
MERARNNLTHSKPAKDNHIIDFHIWQSMFIVIEIFDLQTLPSMISGTIIGIFDCECDSIRGTTGLGPRQTVDYNTNDIMMSLCVLCFADARESWWYRWGHCELSPANGDKNKKSRVQQHPEFQSRSSPEDRINRIIKLTGRRSYCLYRWVNSIVGARATQMHASASVLVC